jgi:hypothetical protein
MLPAVRFDVRCDSRTIGDYRRHGFVTVGRITADEEGKWLEDVYDRLLIERLESAGLRTGGLRSPPGNTLWISLTEWETIIFERTAMIRNARTLAAELLEVSEAEVSLGIRFFFKPAKGGRPVPWHQDEAHKDPAYDHRSLNVWVPLEAATEENGCLQYIPGSHKGGIREHRHPGHGAPEVALLTDDVRTCDAVPTPILPLGASIHHCRTVHASGANLSVAHRRAIAIVCSAPPLRRDRPADRPWLNASHLDVPETSF